MWKIHHRSHRAGPCGRAARRAATRFAELSLSEESLLARAEDELLVAVLANQVLSDAYKERSYSCGLSDTSVSPRTLRGAIVAAAGFGAYWPVGGSVHVPRGFVYSLVRNRNTSAGGLGAVHRVICTLTNDGPSPRRALQAHPILAPI